MGRFCFAQGGAGRRVISGVVVVFSSTFCGTLGKQCIRVFAYHTRTYARSSFCVPSTLYSCISYSWRSCMKTEPSTILSFAQGGAGSFFSWCGAVFRRLFPCMQVHTTGTCTNVQMYTGSAFASRVHSCGARMNARRLFVCVSPVHVVCGHRAGISLG